MTTFMLQALLIDHFVTERLYLLYPTTTFVVELVDWAKHPALSNLIYLAQLTHCSACVKALNVERLALPCPIRLQPYEVPNFGLRSYPFCLLSIANIKAYFSFFLSRRAIKQCVVKNIVYQPVPNYVKVATLCLT